MIPAIFPHVYMHSGVSPSPVSSQFMVAEGRTSGGGAHMGSKCCSCTTDGPAPVGGGFKKWVPALLPPPKGGKRAPKASDLCALLCQPSVASACRRFAPAWVCNSSQRRSWS